MNLNYREEEGKQQSSLGSNRQIFWLYAAQGYELHNVIAKN